MKYIVCPHCKKELDKVDSEEHGVVVSSDLSVGRTSGEEFVWGSVSEAALNADDSYSVRVTCPECGEEIDTANSYSEIVEKLKKYLEEV